MYKPLPTKIAHIFVAFSKNLNFIIKLYWGLAWYSNELIILSKRTQIFKKQILGIDKKRENFDMRDLNPRPRTILVESL